MKPYLVLEMVIGLSSDSDQIKIIDQNVNWVVILAILLDVFLLYVYLKIVILIWFFVF